MDESFDAIVIGTGFGGAVVACRLAQAGLRICVLERGRRYESSEPRDKEEPESDFPELPAADRIAPDLARWRWSEDQGLWDAVDLGGAQAVQAAGYGGGSLIYANVHLRAPADVFTNGKWPAGYTAERLTEFYDRAASMLDVKPITEAPFSLIKTDQLLKSATALGRGQDFFHPPLAVSFSDGKNAFGKLQGACRACGECDTGCRYRAKNTLDLNYLALVDDAHNAEVRTLAEATLISELGDRGQDGYEVEYRDHLQGRETVRVRAKHVFVCAGAVHSTALLLASKRAGALAAEKRVRDHGLPRLDRDDQLGRGYFLNADSLGIVYDARLAPDAEGSTRARVLKPTMGPVITGAIVHRDTAAGTWMLVQDGGFPRALARHVGLMRSPLMLRRNRYERLGSEPGGSRAIPVIGPSLPSNLPRAIEPKPLGDAGGIPGGPLTSQLDGLLRIAEGEDLQKMIPPHLQHAVAALRAELDAVRGEQMMAIATASRDRLAEKPARALARCFTLGLTKQPPQFLLRIARPVMRWGYRMAASSTEIAEATQAAIEQRFALGDALKLTSKLARWLLGFDDDHHAHSEHAMVLLAMGRDDTSAVIRLDDAGDPHVGLALTPAAPVYSQQELLMRDVAATLHGKLRVNPAWAFARKPITVHSQGGCRMAKDAQHGVTDEHGQVFAHTGLFVMDAAIFPSSVGVNPSATIAAVAERNVAWFLTRPETAAPKPDAATPHEALTLAWAARAKGWTLTPPTGTGLPPVSAPVGVTFKEELSGYLAEVAAPAIGDDDAYEAAEIAGRPKISVSLKLKASIADISQFLHNDARTAQLSGTARVVTPNLVGDFDVWGVLRLFPEGDDPASGRMEYNLHLLPQRAPGEDPQRPRQEVATLDGYKRVHDDPGPDVWRDTTTLFVTLTPQGPPKTPCHGALHMAMNRFLAAELPSFEVLGTADPARVLWALAAFNAYFFRSVQRVYVPQLNKVFNLVDDIGLR